MRYWRNLLIAAAAGALSAAGPPALAQGQAASVIVLNYELLVRNSVGGRDMAAKLQQIRTSAEQELQPEVNSLEQERQRIAQASQGMSEDQIRANSALVGQIQTLTQRAETFQQRRVAAARDLQCTEQTAVNRFNELITPMVREVMEQRGAGIVLDRQAANLVLPSYDATNDVLTLIDQRVRTVEVARVAASTCEPAAPAEPASEQPQGGRSRR